MSWVVEICDSSWNHIGALDAWDSLSFTDKLCDVGFGSVNTTASEDHRQLVQIGSTVLVRQDGIVRQAGLLSFGESTADSIVMKLAWKDANQYLAERVAYPDPTRPAESQTVAYDERAGQLSTVIHGYVMANCGPNAPPDRQIGLMGTDPGVGPQVVAAVQARFDSLLELCRKLAMPVGVVFRIVTVDRQHWLDIYQAVDLSGSVVFSQVTKTLGSNDWALSPPSATHIVAGGQGEGVDREFLTVTSGESLAQREAWNRRVELFVDNTSAKSSAQLRAETERTLATKGQVLAAKFTPGMFSDWSYGVDYRIGDRVGCELRPGWVVVKPITEVTTKVSQAGVVTVTPLAGDPDSTAGLRQDLPVRELRRDMSQLQRNR